MWKKIVLVANITKMLLKNCFIIIYLYIPNVIIVSYQQLGLLFWIKKQFDDFFSLHKYYYYFIIVFPNNDFAPRPYYWKLKDWLDLDTYYDLQYFFSFSYMKMNFFFVLIFFPFRNPQPIRLIFITFFCIFQCQTQIDRKKKLQTII